jgi:hypothetical protein
MGKWRSEGGRIKQRWKGRSEEEGAWGNVKEEERFLFGRVQVSEVIGKEKIWLCWFGCRGGG